MWLALPYPVKCNANAIRIPQQMEYFKYELDNIFIPIASSDITAALGNMLRSCEFAFEL